MHKVNHPLPIYLDYMASTPLDEAVYQAMVPFLAGNRRWGNASSQHPYGQRLRAAIEEAACHVAAYIHAEPHEIIWTSGATEAINLALKGAAHFYKRQGRHIIASAIEHKAVLATLEALAAEGFSVSLVPPTAEGLLDVEALATYIRHDTILISVTHVNSEMGTIQDLSNIGKLAKQHGLLFHVDAAQSPGKCLVDCKANAIDLLSLSAHKVYGPVGIGALYVRQQSKVQLCPQIHGGGQQANRRSGSLPTAAIVGMGEAFRIAKVQLPTECLRISELQKKLWSQLKILPGIILHGSTKDRVPHNLNFSVQGITREALLTILNEVAFSMVSACSSALAEPSHVLKAMGVEDALARSALRISLGRYTTLEEVEQAACILCKQIQHFLKGTGH